MKRLVWLASYPKSGNTWFRVFLENYRRNCDTPADINALDSHYGVGARAPFDEAVGLESGELTHAEIERLRPEAYLHQARRAPELLFCKVHDACTRTVDGRLLFPPEATGGAFYFVRNPLDVCVSYAHHSATENLDGIIDSMADPDRVALAQADTLGFQLPQRFLTWSRHVLSWVDEPELPVHVIRYEDMKRRPEETFGAAVRALGWPLEAERLRRAIAQSEFSELKRQELAGGFGEKMPLSASFFRKGEIGSWREVLTPEQIARVIRAQGGVMRRFGYLTAEGAPLD